jgi:hypothetical protein
MRGIRNNNPLNIRHSADQWQGASTTQTDKNFVQFQSMAYGYRAAWKILDTYCLRFRRERKVYNVRTIISRWAPPTENDTDAYIKSVVRLSGLGGNENIPRPNRYRNFERLEKTARLIAAMTCVECGLPMKQVDMKAIWQGYDLAYPGRREKYDVTYAKQSAHTDEEAKEEKEEEPSDRQLARIERLSVWDEYWDWSGFG